MNFFKGIKIDIGAGNPEEGENQATNGYILQDIDHHKGIDIVCNIRDLKKELTRLSILHLKEETSKVCSVIRASHVLEHFHSKELVNEILPMLKDCLVDGGYLKIIVPNFEWHCKLLLAGHEEKAVYYAYGGGNDIYDLHHTGWTPNLATRWLTEAGFEIVDIYSADCIHIEAKKL